MSDEKRARLSEEVCEKRVRFAEDTKGGIPEEFSLEPLFEENSLFPAKKHAQALREAHAFFNSCCRHMEEMEKLAADALREKLNEARKIIKAIPEMEARIAYVAAKQGKAWACVGQQNKVRKEFYELKDLSDFLGSGLSFVDYVRVGGEKAMREALGEIESRNLKFGDILSQWERAKQMALSVLPTPEDLEAWEELAQQNQVTNSQSEEIALRVS